MADAGGFGQRNVLGGALETCSVAPRTGFYRTGCCETGPDDVGRHTVCVEATAEFLAFSKSVGNDLSSPWPPDAPPDQRQFPGLQPGDRWCLCAARWKQALLAGQAPKVILTATNEATLEIVTLDELLAHTAGGSA